MLSISTMTDTNTITDPTLRMVFLGVIALGFADFVRNGVMMVRDPKSWAKSRWTLKGTITPERLSSGDVTEIQVRILGVICLLSGLGCLALIGRAFVGLVR